MICILLRLIFRGLTGFWDLGSGKFRKRDVPVVDLVLRRKVAEITHQVLVNSYNNLEFHQVFQVKGGIINRS